MINTTNGMKKVLVIGETCTDEFRYGSVKRLAPEAPAPVFVPEKNIECFGMAGNVYNNLKSLNVTCDIITNKSIEKITKTRFIDHRTNTLLLRVDTGEEYITPVCENRIGDDLLAEYHAVVISDYDKGFLSEEKIEFICNTHPRVFIDTKKTLGSWCSNAFLIKINSVEYERSRHAIEMYQLLRKKLIVTHGHNGCSYDDKLYTVDSVEVKDLAGAGDTFLSGLVAKYLQIGSIKKSIEFANMCATVTVQRRGVYSDFSYLHKEKK